ncbi:MAG: MotA/TolQ/ExbB proton channel family protein [Candidatus Latescibacterota bacterium]|nr:MotA/TolQ/ExbB proton channel family protein [Candidatus Latescibacterota bacterium]
MTFIEILISVVFSGSCAVVGAMSLMQRAETLGSEDGHYGLVKGQASMVASIIGGLAGLCIGVLFVYFYFKASPANGLVEWVGRGSYALIIAAFFGHLFGLIHIWMRLIDEQEDLRVDANGEGRPQKPTLSVRRRREFRALREVGYDEIALRSRDDDVVEELIAVIGDRLIAGQRALSRLPFYGYLGTVCGILLMADELTNLSEATESFKVLRDMAGGLVLAFQTTLAALVAYLPLRKGFDKMMSKAARLERAWLAWRDEELLK